MPRLPRDVSGSELAEKLKGYGYKATRQKGSHIRLTRATRSGEHHITIPNHKALRIGTLNNILGDVARELGESKDSIITALFG